MEPFQEEIDPPQPAGGGGATDKRTDYTVKPRQLCSRCSSVKINHSSSNMNISHRICIT